MDFGGSFWILGDLFWISDLKKKVFGIRMVIFWGVRKVKKIDWSEISLIFGF